MSISFSALEIGQGDAFLLENDDWKCLFDSGSSKSRIVALLKQKAINHLNLVICSHNDSDHAKGFLGILDKSSNITVDEIWLPSLFGSIMQYAVDHGIVTDFYDSDAHRFDDEYLEAFYDRESECLHYNIFDEIFMYAECIDYLFHKRFHKSFSSCRVNLKKLFNNIEKILKLAYHRGCKIRWFLPVDGCVNNVVDYGFTALNSVITHKITRLNGVDEFLCALMLTASNKYSLVFEFAKEHTPIVRFSADSDCTCQSVIPYVDNIIITAPHHGSEANKIVYNKIQGNDIIWVRSDRKHTNRPCVNFKNQPTRYCLACCNGNFINEVCFDYIGKRWQCIRGNMCVC